MINKIHVNLVPCFDDLFNTLMASIICQRFPISPNDLRGTDISDEQIEFITNE